MVRPPHVRFGYPAPVRPAVPTDGVAATLPAHLAHLPKTYPKARFVASTAPGCAGAIAMVIDDLLIHDPTSIDEADGSARGGQWYGLSRDDALMLAAYNIPRLNQTGDAGGRIAATVDHLFAVREQGAGPEIERALRMLLGISFETVEEGRRVKWSRKAN